MASKPKGNPPEKKCWRVSDKKVHKSHMHDESFAWCPGYTKEDRDKS